MLLSATGWFEQYLERTMSSDLKYNNQQVSVGAIIFRDFFIDKSLLS